MTNLADRASNQILLLAPDLLGESLAFQLNNADQKLKVFLNSEKLTEHPCLVIWSIENVEVPNTIALELKRLQDHWDPAPVLAILPAQISLSTNELLRFSSPGLLQDPDLRTLIDAINTLKEGGRVVKLKDQGALNETENEISLGIGQWLLITGIQQINQDLKSLDLFLQQSSTNPLLLTLAKGRKRELNSAKNLLFWLWGPPQVALSPLKTYRKTLQTKSEGNIEKFGTSLSLKERNPLAVWQLIKGNLEKAVNPSIQNLSGGILAIEGLNPSRQKDLFLALIEQLDKILKNLINSNVTDQMLQESWNSLQSELRQESLRKIAGNYLRLSLKGESHSVIDQLIKFSDLETKDEELPSEEMMLEPLVLNKPVVVEGLLLPADDPRAIIHLEKYFNNWLVRTAELIAAEIIGVCSEWPELRRYLLKSKLISTRELERLRNQLNSHNRWISNIQRPIDLYESKRVLYILNNGLIKTVSITEPRDEELRQLGWWQQQVALIVEARDAISPQLQSLVRHFGDLMVVFLTKVVGRAIGLVGKGIAQGMGRSLGRS